MTATKIDLGDEHDPLWECTECGTSYTNEEKATSCCESGGGWDDADFTAPETDVWPSAHAEHDAWMLRKNGKKPWAPWADPDAPVTCNRPEHDRDDVTCAECEHSAQFKWGSDGSPEHVHADMETALNWREKHPEARKDLTFIQRKADPFAFVDGDDVRCPETGEVHPAFVDVLEQLGATYADVSTSGTGVHAMYRGSLPDRVKQSAFEIDDEPWGENDDLPTVEIYDGKHVCVATGGHVPGTPEEVNEWDADALEALLDEHDELPPEEPERPRPDDYDRDDYDPDATGSAELTTDIRDCYYALDALDVEDVAAKTIVASWNDGAGTSDGNRAFHPTWGPNSNGTATYVDTDQGIYVDVGDVGGYGGPVVMALIDGGELSADEATPKVSGKTWFKGYNLLREEHGYDLPLFVPEKGTEGRDGKYEQTPLWALRNAAVHLGVCESGEFVERESDDPESDDTYLGFPDGETYNEALDALEAEGIDHGRDRVNTGPDHPKYSVMSGIDLHLYPVTGEEVEIVVSQNGVQEYSERADAPVHNSGAAFWESPRKRSLIAGRIAESLTGVDKEELKEKVKATLVDIANDSSDDEWCEQLRTEEYDQLTERTKQVVCNPTPDGAFWKVEMEPHPDRPNVGRKTLDFDEGDLNNSDPGALETKHLGTFLAKIDVDPATWEQVQDTWIANAEIRELDKGDDQVEHAVEELLYEIAESYSILPESAKSSFDWNRKNGLYAEDDYDEPVVYVPGARIAEFRDKHVDDDDVNLSVELRDRDIMADTSKKKSIVGKRRRVWPIRFSHIDRGEDELDGIAADENDAPDEVDL
ncbi:MAG: hypothetical protein ABEJ90_01700 [Halobacterium sp.]